MRQLVHPDLFTIWYNASQIVAPSVLVRKTPASTILIPALYPKVDWINVNQRFLTNLPKPKPFPLHGCSQDPQHYQTGKDSWNGIIPSNFQRGSSFGTEYGYYTDAGIVAVPDHSQFGFIWGKDENGDSTWILSASHGDDQGGHGRRDQGEHRRGGERIRRQRDRRGRRIALP